MPVTQNEEIPDQKLISRERHTASWPDQGRVIFEQTAPPENSVTQVQRQLETQM